jgi:hypothetical protein
MAGWNPGKVAVFKTAFFEFLQDVRINSKELGNVCLGEVLYRAQLRFLDQLFDGLSQDKHDFKHLKSRQLGVSTITRALALFWMGIHHGLKGYLVMDTDQHKEEARLEILAMIDSLPPRLAFPRVKRQNRYLIELANGSLLNFASAGVKAGKQSGVLGRSSGINFVIASEMCSWENTEGLEAFMNALAQDFENRLYIWESTGRGYNQWWEMWTEARKDDVHQVCVFSGWWAKDNQVIHQNDPDWELYGIWPLTDKEKKKILAVRDLYGWEISPEQIAWVRRHSDPNARAEVGNAPEFEPSQLRLVEQPWTEHEAFAMTGATFFDPEVLTTQASTHTSQRYKTYSYMTGIEFQDCRIFPARNKRSVELKVWDDPDEDGIYVIASDVAFGINDRNDRSSIQVLRCYADGLDQVAEYAWPLINSRAFAWVIASLLGWYAGERAQVYNILEINGPGEATWNELQSLKRQLAHGYAQKSVEEKGLNNIFRNVHNYIYNRSDAMGPGFSWQWKTNVQLKVTIMERLRDFVSNGMLRIRSIETLEEMRSIARDGDSIEAQGNHKDDRVLALALGVRCWEDRPRRALLGQKLTRDAVRARKVLTVQDQYRMFNDAQLEDFFKRKQRARVLNYRELLRQRHRRGY